mmetsp:Transcript_76838/g.205298  ORF Transcript_76838/g.205298 Transcript_76838/m.205298 type:complete len:210 (+) Transcript_76838:192-821(+)
MAPRHRGLAVRPSTTKATAPRGRAAAELGGPPTPATTAARARASAEGPGVGATTVDTRKAVWCGRDLAVVGGGTRPRARRRREGSHCGTSRPCLSRNPGPGRTLLRHGTRELGSLLSSGTVPGSTKNYVGRMWPNTITRLCVTTKRKSVSGGTQRGPTARVWSGSIRRPWRSGSCRPCPGSPSRSRPRLMQRTCSSAPETTHTRRALLR